MEIMDIVYISLSVWIGVSTMLLSIFQDAKDIDTKDRMQHHRCWAVYAAIRYALAWHDHPEGGDTVDFGEPLGYGEPLPKCEVEEG